MRPQITFLAALFVLGLAWPTAARAQADDAPRPIDEVERDTHKHKPASKAKPASEPEQETTADEEAPAAAAKKGKKSRAAAEEDEPSTSQNEDETGLSTTTDNGDDPPLVDETSKSSTTDKPLKLLGTDLGPMFGPYLSGSSGKGSTEVRTPPKPITVSTATDADLLSAWTRWRKATSAQDSKGAHDAQMELLRLKEDLGITDLDPFATGFIRASRKQAGANQHAVAIEYAQTAVQLAPHLPYAHAALAEAYFEDSPTEVGRYFAASRSALKALARDPRYLRPALADLGTGTLLALMATAVAAILALFLRKARYFFHDFHHLFPKAAARWQSAAAACILLLIPAVLHLGLVPVLLVLFASVTFYLKLPERLVAAALLAMLGALPLVAGVLAEQTGFAGTIAEDVYRMERGGVGASASAQRTAKRMADDKADFLEIFALARYELRRGQLDAAIEHFKRAATLKGNEARLLTNLGNALLAKGEADNALEMYQQATEADAALAAPLFNLAKLHSRRAAALPDEAVGAELDKGHTAMTKAQSLDETLLARELSGTQAEETLANRLLLSPGLSSSEIAALVASTDASEKVEAQLSRTLLGTGASMPAFLYPLIAALALVGLGLLGGRFNVSKECEKCGRSVCRRDDPELGVGSLLCGQCVNVYARKGVVPAPLKVRKQLEVARYQTRMGRISYVLGLIWSGAGHVFSGWPVRGTLYGFLFSFALFQALFRSGVMRSPFGALPEVWRLVPVGLLFLSVYLLSLRGLYKRQTE